MTLPLFASFGLLAPLHGLLRRLGSASTALRGVPPTIDKPVATLLRSTAGAPRQSVGSAEPCAMNGAVARGRTRSHRPVRVVRVLESGHAPFHGGRMMISGRMADVCAELERMAEREAALQVVA